MARLTTEQTAPENHRAQIIHRLSPETVATLHSVLDDDTAAEAVADGGIGEEGTANGECTPKEKARARHHHQLDRGMTIARDWYYGETLPKAPQTVATR
jgi:hypothetical protein